MRIKTISLFFALSPFLFLNSADQPDQSESAEESLTSSALNWCQETVVAGSDAVFDYWVGDAEPFTTQEAFQKEERLIRNERLSVKKVSQQKELSIPQDLRSLRSKVMFKTQELTSGGRATPQKISENLQNYAKSLGLLRQDSQFDLERTKFYLILNEICERYPQEEYDSTLKAYTPVAGSHNYVPIVAVNVRSLLLEDGAPRNPAVYQPAHYILQAWKDLEMRASQKERKKMVHADITKTPYPVPCLFSELPPLIDEINEKTSTPFSSFWFTGLLSPRNTQVKS